MNKNVVCHVFPSEKLTIWSLESGAIYSKSVSFYIDSVAINKVNLVKASSSTLSAGEYYFDFNTKVLYVRLLDDSSPADSYVVGTYRIFLSSRPIKLPNDLASGEAVDYDAIINKVPDFPVGIDTANQFGIALESSGRITFYNCDFWVNYFDKLIWENKRIKLWSYYDNTYKKLFDGQITGKSYSSSSVSFSISDYVYSLRKSISVETYSENDGDIKEDFIGKPKRVIYGRVDGLDSICLDNVLYGFQLTGTIEISYMNTTVNGTGTEFLKELSPKDEILVVVNDIEYTYGIESITSDTTLIISDEPEINYSGTTINKPDGPYRYKNRTFQLSGHKLGTPTTTVSSVEYLNRFTVDDSTDFFANDNVMIGLESAIIRRVSGNIISLRQNLDASPSIGTTMVKNPIRNAYFNKRKLYIDRDWTLIQNDSSGAVIQLEDDAELNQTIQQPIIGTIAINNGSRNVSGTGTKFVKQFKPRDFLKTTDITHTIWYEVLEVVDDTTMTTRVAYAGANFSGGAKLKSVTYIDDDSHVIFDVYGKENSSGKWIKTASDAIEDILELASITDIDTSSFAQSKIDAPFTLSMAIPYSVGGDMPEGKKIIGDINKSVFGALISNNEFLPKLNILSPDRPLNVTPIKDDDILTFNIQSKSDTYRTVTVKYRHKDLGPYTLNKSNSVYSYTSEFTDNLIDNDNDKEIDIYLYFEDDSNVIAQRYAFFHSLSQSILNITCGNVELDDYLISDKVLLYAKKMYNRFGSNDDYGKVVIVSATKKNGENVQLTTTDLGNWFNRVGAIASNDALDYDQANNSEKILNGYIVDNSTSLADNTEDSSNTNLIG